MIPVVHIGISMDARKMRIGWEFTPEAHQVGVTPERHAWTRIVKEGIGDESMILEVRREMRVVTEAICNGLYDAWTPIPLF